MRLILGRYVVRWTAHTGAILNTLQHRCSHSGIGTRNYSSKLSQGQFAMGILEDPTLCGTDSPTHVVLTVEDNPRVGPRSIESLSQYPHDRIHISVYKQGRSPSDLVHRFASSSRNNNLSVTELVAKSKSSGPEGLGLPYALYTLTLSMLRFRAGGFQQLIANFPDSLTGQSDETRPLRRPSDPFLSRNQTQDWAIK